MAMKAVAFLFLLSAILAPGLIAQTKSPSAKTSPRVIRISPGIAEKLLIHKVELVYPHAPGSRVQGTVTVAFMIDKNGNVLHPTVVSGPAMLQQPVLDVVQKYKYKPYLLNGRAVEVRTTASVVISLGLSH